MNQESAFMSSLMTFLLDKFNIKIRTVAPITISLFKLNMVLNPYQQFLLNILPTWGQMWQKYLPLATFAYDTFSTSNLGNYSPTKW